jgi:hypothetical protein
MNSMATTPINPMRAPTGPRNPFVAKTKKG